MAFEDVGCFELEPLAAEPQETALRLFSAQVEDLFWSRNFWKAPYFRSRPSPPLPKSAQSRPAPAAKPQQRARWGRKASERSSPRG